MRAGIAFIFAITIASLLPAVVNASLFSQANYTSGSANLTINQTAQYISAINQSGYLVFYPNLTQAYSYLNRSIGLERTAPSSAVMYANMARDSAASEYARISTYKQDSLIVLIVYTAITALILRMYMKPIGKTSAKKRARR